MNWTKKGLVAIVLALLATMAAFYFIVFFSKKPVDPWLLIPNNAALIVEVSHPKELFETLANKNEFWKSWQSAKEIEDLNAILGNLDSINKENLPVLNELFEGPFIFSLYPSPDSSKFSYLVSVQNKHLSKKERLNIWAGQILNNSFEIVEKTELENAIFIKRVGAENGFYIVVFEKTLLISPDMALLERINNEEKVENFHFTNSNQFQELKRTAGKNVQARIFINYHFLQTVFSSFLNKNTPTALDWMDNFAGWSVMDLLVKDDEILLSGYTDFENSKQFLAAYSNDAPIKNQVYSVLPYNTTFFLDLGSENFKLKAGAEKIAELTKNVHVDIDALLTAIGNEICVVSTATKYQQIEENTWVIAQIKDKESALVYLNQLAANSQLPGSEKYKDYIFKKIDADNLLPGLFGLPFQKTPLNWYTIVGGYLVFANSTAALTNYISSLDMEKTLDRNENFIDFSNNLSSSSNITLLIKPNALTAFTDYFLENSITQKSGLLKTIQNSINMLSFQFNAGEPYFYTSFSANHSKTFKEEKPYIWAYNLHAEIASKPFLIRNPNTKQDFIFIVDELFTLYCLNTEGKLLWQKRLDSPLLGNIQDITNPKTKANQVLFNTKDFIYLMSLDGENASGFPAKISPTATNGLTLYKKANEYRIIIAQSDKTIHNYTIEGEAVTGWKLPKMENLVSEPICYLNSKNKDFLVITDDKETVQIIDKFGSPLKLKKAIEKGNFSGFYVNMTNSKGEIITTDKQGRLVYISDKGKLQNTGFGSFSPEHYFLYEDFNGDKVMDFIYIDGKKLTVLDRFKKTVFSYSFQNEIVSNPVFYQIDKNRFLLAIVPENENSIYFFNKKGEPIVFSGFPDKAFFELSFQDKDEVSLLVGASNSIYYYRLK